MSGTVYQSLSADQILEQACIRNTRLELHYENANGHIIVAQTRALELTGSTIIADALSFAESGETIPLRRPAIAHLQIRRQRFQFATLIEEDHVLLAKFGPNSGFGITLRRPRSLSSSQRRAHVRVSLHASEPVCIWLAQAVGSDPEGCHIDAVHFVGRMLNLSAGGASVLVEDLPSNRAEPGDRYFLSFQLPGHSESYCLLGSVRHIRIVESSGSYRIAFAFKPWNGAPLKRDQQHILRFIVEQERAQLRRR